MSDILSFYAATILLAASLASIAIWAPRRLLVRAAGVVLLGLLIPAAYAGYVDLLSQPKPVSLEWVHRNAKEATVLGASIQEGKAIYVWLQLPGSEEPRAYTLPYDLETAKQLSRAGQEAEEGSGTVKMRKPFERGPEREEAMFYAPPPAPLPDKEPMGETPAVYLHPSQQR